MINEVLSRLFYQECILQMQPTPLQYLLEICLVSWNNKKQINKNKNKKK